mmetsp:Transcript_70822/g.142590  ORF Transcript_70822/g.142590 Transcript_70822/m.142590 type:complete len:541 (-) Transcript_70822:16-1638(-)
MAAVQAYMDRVLTAKKDGGLCCLCVAPVSIGEKLWPIKDNSGSQKLQYAHRTCAAVAAGCSPDKLEPPPCKHWVKRGSCAFKETCFFGHANEDIMSSKSKQVLPNKRGGPRKRRPVANDSRAFALRAFLIDTFGVEIFLQGSGVLDVGGGNGELAFQIANLNQGFATVVDPRPLRLRRFARKLAFGMYTKNIALARYNHPRFPAGCTVAPSDMVSPGHLRVLFQTDAASTGRKRREAPPHPPLQEKVAGSAFALSEGTPIPVLDTLADEKSFLGAVAHAKATSWTRKGLVHEESVGGEEDGKNGDEADHGDELGDELEVASGDKARNPTSTSNLESADQRKGGKMLDSPNTSVASEEGAVAATGSGGGGGKENEEAIRATLASECESLDLPTELDYDSSVALVRDASLIVGLHPDQAAAEIVCFAAKWKKPFAVVPCCVYKHQFPYRAISAHMDRTEVDATGIADLNFTKQGSRTGCSAADAPPQRKLSSHRLVSSYDDLVEWCVMNGPPGTKVAELDFEGKNKVVYWDGQIQPVVRDAR